MYRCVCRRDRSRRSEISRASISILCLRGNQQLLSTSDAPHFMQNLSKKEHGPCMFLSSGGFLAGYVSTAPAEEDQVLEEAICELSLSIRNSLVLTNSQPLSARDVVLRKCGQTEPLSFTECYTNT